MFRTDRIAAALALVGYAGVLLGGLGGPVNAQSRAKAKPPVKAKPAAAKPPANKGKQGPIVLGTTQLPGDFGKFGQTYTIGKYAPLNFTLTSARYTVDRFSVGNNVWTPKADEKLLVLKFTVHNPRPQETNLSWSSFRFTAVDAQDTNREYIQAIVRTGQYGEGLNVNLKPAQKVECEVAILVAANGVTPKLIVQRDADAPVVRYDLRGKVDAVPAPFLDPAATDGATTRNEVPATAGTYYPLAALDVKLESTGSLAEKVPSRELKPGYRNFTATFSVKNPTPVKRNYYWSHWEAELRDADGEKVPYTQALLKASRLETGAGGDLEPGEEARFRFFFPLPENVQAKTLYLRDRSWTGGKGRVLVFDLSSATAAPAQGE
jgi:hypothetical protein